MPIVVQSLLSKRIDRVVGDICTLLHDDSPTARATALRWVAHVLQDANSRRKWRFLEKLGSTVLTVGQDIVQTTGDIDQVAAVYGPRRLTKLPLAQLVELRQEAAANNRPNAGPLTSYALEGRKRLHLWPAPAGSAAAFTADAATDLLTLASVPTTGAPVRVGTTGTLPAPLLATTTYYAIAVSATTMKLAATYAGALAGTAIDLTDAGTGTHTLYAPVVPFALLFTRPMDLEVCPDSWETLILNGVIGTFGRHFDRDALVEKPEAFERRYEAMLKRGDTDGHDVELIQRWQRETPTSTVSANSATNTANSYTVPASLTGIGYVTIETGDYPLVVS